MFLTEKQFKFAYLFAKYKSKIKWSIVAGLVILNIILIGFFVFKTFFYFKDRKNYQIMIDSLSKNLIDYNVIREKNKPKDLVILLTESVKSEKQKFDVVSQIENLNSQFVAQYDYQFVLDGMEGKTKTNFILPNEKKFLMDFNFESLSKNSIVECRIKNVQWKRIRYLSKILKTEFKVENIKYYPAGAQITINKKRDINQVDFEVINNSSYSFWDAIFKVILYQNKKIIGVNIIPTKQFLSREKKFLSASWNNFLPLVTEVIIEPEADTLNIKNLMPVK